MNYVNMSININNKSHTEFSANKDSNCYIMKKMVCIQTMK